MSLRLTLILATTILLFGSALGIFFGQSGGGFNSGGFNSGGFGGYGGGFNRGDPPGFINGAGSRYFGGARPNPGFSSGFGHGHGHGYGRR